jgi:HPt (histidine-containing phosphotransfer) domain-containing protein
MNKDDTQRIVVKVDPDLEPIIPQFLQNTGDDIKTINRGLEQADFSTVQRTGHSMKGYGSGFGFHFISEVGKRIEDAAREKNREEIAKGVSELEKYLEQVEIIYA